MEFIVIVCFVVFVMITLYAALVAASDADDWEERMHDEQKDKREK